MPSLANLMEDYRNWRGRQEWEQGKGWQDFFGGDPRAQEQFEKLSGFGTDAGGLVGMIKASHGSPHMFDKFDFSKIGTGEGAQAYGHGLYFGEGFDSPVAQSYRTAGVPGNEYKNKIFLKQYHADNAKLRGDKEGEERALAALAELKANPPGHMYNAELRWPDAAREASDPLGEHHLLDWDAQLRRQPGDILDLLQKSNLYTQNIPASRTDIDEAKKVFSENKTKENLDALHKLMNQGRSPTGAMFYRQMQNIMGNEKASEQLRKAGIPGIRYLDQASRGQGAGTRNYVMFDDQFPNIVSRNGASLSDLLRR